MGASASALERKGIEKEKGNINREIKKHNGLVKEIKNRLSEINSWLGSLIGKLQDRYDQYKEDKKEEVENKAELFNLYEYISIYHDIQVDKRKHLNSYSREKKGLADLKKLASARVYLQNNNLEIIADLQGKISNLQSKNRKVSKEIKAKTEEIDKLNKCLVYADIIKDTKGVYQTWKKKKLFKDSYYKQNQATIDKYKRVRTYLEKQTGSSAIKPKEWRKSITTT